MKRLIVKWWKQASQRSKRQMEILEIPVADLTPHPRNARQHSARNIKAIAASLDRFGQQTPIVVDGQNQVLKGCGTLEAAKLISLPKLFATVTDLNDRSALGYSIADNRSGDKDVGSDWDYDVLSTTLEDLDADTDFDIDAIGFNEREFDEILDSVGSGPVSPKDPGAGEAPPDPITRPGDLWQLGGHRVLCGDSTSAEDVERLMDGQRAGLCMTDPPYGADIQYATHDDTQDALTGLIAGFFPLAEKHSEVIALTPGINNLWKYKSPDWVLCWFYGAGTGRTPWGFTAWQPVMVWGKCPKLGAGEGCHPDGFKFMMTNDDAKANKELDHACPKPLSIWKRFMERLTNKKSSVIYEPFMGAGTTLIAADQLGLKCFGIEISPAYCDVICDRWMKMTGQIPTREDGSPFERGTK